VSSVSSDHSTPAEWSEEELTILIQLCAIHDVTISKEVLEPIVELLSLQISPDAIFQMLLQMRTKRIDQVLASRTREINK